MKSILFILVFGFSFSYANTIEPIAKDLADAFHTCGHNGGSLASTYDVDAFKSEIFFVAQLKKEDGVCAKQRIYSSSKREAKFMFDLHLYERNSDPFAKKDLMCVDYHIPYAWQDLVNYMNDEDTVEVVASVFNNDYKMSDRDSASCAYYQFYVFRKSGTLLKVEFNHTD